MLWATLALCTLMTSNANAEEPEPDYILRRLTPPRVVNITVEVPSARADFGQNTDCSTFALKPHHVRRFLKQAQVVSKRDYNNYHPWAECYAEGTVTYANGMRAEWAIESAGRGVLVPTNGRRKGVFYFLYCETCESMGWRE